MPDFGNTAVFSQSDSANDSGTMPSWKGSAAPSTLDDAGRAFQAAATRQWYWTNITAIGTGSGSAHVLTYAVAPAALYHGQIYGWKAGFAGGGTDTLNINGLGAKGIKKDVGGTLTATSAGDIANGQRMLVAYDLPTDSFVWINWQGPAPTTYTGGVLTTATSMSGKAFSEAKGAAVASAATTDIWTPADGNFLHITGTTTITSLGTAPQAGAERTVIFDGALTLTHNATSLILPGAANITTAAGDRMIVRADTTANMIVVNYTKASGVATVTPPSKVVIKKAADQSVASATLANDSDFTFSLAANKKYLVNLYLDCTHTNVDDFQFDITGPASPNAVTISAHASPASGAGTNNIGISEPAAAFGSPIAITFDDAVLGTVWISAYIDNGANAGTFQFRWANNTGATSRTIKARSYMVYEQIN
jgi:hypothetical protein